MLYESSYLEEKAVLQTAARMCAAARTAPKAHGKDTVHTLVLTGEEKEQLAQKMEAIGTREMGAKMNTWHGRDAANLRAAQAVVLIGTEQKQRGVPHCGYCGFRDCMECKNNGGNCAFAYVDLGIAISSAVSLAAVDMVDNRIMYSIGKAAAEMGYADGVLWLGIPLSIAGKNIFFDRGIFHD
ncbi:DUF2148 domain-containing protein [Lachnospiraceae bacterium NSJ-143]|nr:DUF2148 domain-containing protein [Lachnospiraceae bacterium NSJ-143]